MGTESPVVRSSPLRAAAEAERDLPDVLLHDLAGGSTRGADTVDGEFDRGLRDFLTGVANRALFQDRMEQSLARVERTGAPAV